MKNKDGEVVEGDAKQVKRQRDTWTFSRDLSSSDRIGSLLPQVVRIVIQLFSEAHFISLWVQNHEKEKT